MDLGSIQLLEWKVGFCYQHLEESRCAEPSVLLGPFHQRFVGDRGDALQTSQHARAVVDRLGPRSLRAVPCAHDLKLLSLLSRECLFNF
jgi:hypothetical protein